MPERKMPLVVALVVGLTVGAGLMAIGTGQHPWNSPPTTSEPPSEPIEPVPSPALDPPAEPTPLDIVAAIRPYVVQISTRGELYRRLMPNMSFSAEGIGFIFDANPDGSFQVITNSTLLGFEHVMEAGWLSAGRILSYEANIRMPNGLPAQIVKVLDHQSEDAAVLFVTSEDGPDQQLGRRDDHLAIGDPVIAVGRRIGDMHYYTKGNIDTLTEDFIGLSATIDEQNRGGPLLNAKLQLIGLNVFGLDDDDEKVSYAVDIEKLVNTSMYIEVDIENMDAISRHIDQLYFGND